MLKLNVDGCCKGNPGEPAGGGILRDHNGDMRMAFYSYYGILTNNNAEINALLKGLQWCVANHLDNVIIETDSKTLVNWIKSTSKGTWTIRSELEKIINLLEKGNYQVKHFYWEANCVADIMDNIGAKEKKEFSSLILLCCQHKLKLL
ncbi:hypothetical protein KY290_007892 [Solanum tuberosum]|uniref:RNase H type-1 domain-containing protein n=1 Tax=Solanum tuberosum TaxID=4113 RepID=A0ABQ7W6V3_SOLTU|nr:hypothetical protein KY290_007892 [Solanum tuberosum]